MGQALTICRACETPEACYDCTELHEWIMEHMEPRWISVKDKLPVEWKHENGDLVNYLVYMPDYGVDIASYFKPAERWVCMGLPVTVTHWMPMPEPPKEDEDENA